MFKNIINDLILPQFLAYLVNIYISTTLNVVQFSQLEIKSLVYHSKK